MSASSDILHLFVELACAIRQRDAGAGDDGGEAAAASISSVVVSLKPNPDSSSGSTRVLDAALSLMCFRAPQVYGSRVDAIMKTMVSVLSSSVSCRVHRLEEGSRKEEMLSVGSSICSADRGKLLRACVDVLGCLKGHALCQSLVHAVLKVAVSASNYQSMLPVSRVYYERSEFTREDKSFAISKLESLLPVETSVNYSGIPLRLLLWYIDPLLLKDAISNILRETIHRPFLCLKNEFHERMTWRLLIICLVTSPTIFTQTRALLHKWFLVTGLTSVLELQIALVSSLLDVLSRPMWWGVSMELGLKLPFSRAYFPTCHSELLAVLTGPISCERFLNLVGLIGLPIAPTGNNKNLMSYHLSPGSFHWNGEKVTRIDCNSTWAMLMNFPTWFYFATLLIFCGGKFQGIFLTSTRSRAVEAQPRTEDEMELRHAAARYIAFVLSPLDEGSFNLCLNLVNEMSESWTMKSISDSTCRFLTLEAENDNASDHCKKLRKPKASETHKFDVATDRREGAGAGTAIWLREFHKYCEKSKVVAGHSQGEGGTVEIVNARSSLLFTRIPLGVLVCCANYLSEREYALLLNYAARGEILHIDDSQIMENEEPRKKSFGIYGHEYTRLSSGRVSNWAFGGATIVFDLFDCIEEIFNSYFDSEDERLDFLCLMKTKTVSYLRRCVRELLLPHVQLDEDGRRDVMLKDLSLRLIRWGQQGREVFEGCGTFNDILDDLNRR